MVARGRGACGVLIVEGGGDRNMALRTACREAFSGLQAGAGVTRRLRVHAMGGRKAAYDRFVHEFAAASRGEKVVLLVDAEEVVTGTDRWQHVKQRPGDGWDKPKGAEEHHLHFMAVAMETWLLADPHALARVFGKDFKPGVIPKWPALEAVSKATINDTLQRATGGYDNGEHSFRALQHVSPSVLEAACPSAKELFDHLRG